MQKMKIRRKVPKGPNGILRKMVSGEYKIEVVPATSRSKIQGLKRKLNSGEDYHIKPEVLQTKINTVEVDSDNEVVFNVPQAKKLKIDPELSQTTGLTDQIKKVTIEPKPAPKLQGVVKLQGVAKPVQDENSEEIKPRRSPNGYLLSDPLPKGLVLKDLRKKTWKIGRSIGLGGFGEIYSAALLDGEKTCFMI